MTERLVSYELDGDVALIGIDRVAKRNAMNRAVVAQVVEAAARAQQEAHVGVLFGHGEHFSAGLDLVEIRAQFEGGGSDAQKMQRNDGHLGFDQIARGRIPFVAALQGAVIGYGLELAAAAQVRVADTTARFGLPEAMRGIFVGGSGSVRIQRLIGYARMADMMLTRRILSAEEGHALNLCQYLAEPGQALAKARELAASIAENPPMSNWAVCNLLPRMNDLGHDDAMFLEQMGAHYVIGRDSIDRLQAFADKRAETFMPPRGGAGVGGRGGGDGGSGA